MNILVIGGTGFIGSHLVEKLIDEGIKPYCLIRSKLRWLEGKDIIPIYAKDINEPNFVEKLPDFDYIFYLAGLTKAPNYEDFINVNVKNFIEFYNHLIEKNVKLKWFGYLSTMAVNSPNKNGKPLTESSPLNPISYYGKSKALAELYLKGRREYPTFIARLPGVYGERDMDFLTYFKSVKKGVVPVIGNYKTSLIYVKDLVDALYLSFKKRLTGTYYISDGNFYSQKDIGIQSKELLNKKAIYVKIPFWIGYFAAEMNELFSEKTIFNHEKMKEITAGNWICNSAKIEKALDWRAQYDLKKGFEETIKWYKENKYL